jgi:hypothetical protein
MGNRTPQGGRKDIERDQEGLPTDEEREQRGGTAEESVEGAMESEPGVEWHAGEDAGEVPDADDDVDYGDDAEQTGAHPT